jgi:hypothetical protein
MNATEIIASFVVIDDILTAYGHQTDRRAGASDSEVLTVAIVAAAYFSNNHERALAVLRLLHYLSKPLSTSRFNRRLHELADWLPLLVEVLGHLHEHAACLVIDSLPMAVCRRVRAWRCRKVRGREYCGYCAAKKEKFYGWRLHLVATPAGVPVRFVMLPAAYQDLTAIHELLWELPAGVWVVGDKGYISGPDQRSIQEATGVCLVAAHRANMQPNSWEERQALATHRHTIETLNSQLERMGFERLYARTNAGFAIKAHASLLALTIHNFN